MNILNNKYFKLCYRIIAIIVCLIGISLSVNINNEWHLSSFLYYTILSNILCLVMFIVSILTMIKYWNKDIDKTNYSFKGLVILIISVTLIVFHFILRPRMFSMINSAYLMSWSNVIIHYVVPIMTIFDWILFDKKGKLTYNDPLKWLILPFTYWIFTVVYGMSNHKYLNGGSYPYFFLDIDKYGLVVVLRNVLFIAFLFLLLGYAIVFLDHFFKKRQKK